MPVPNTGGLTDAAGARVPSRFDEIDRAEWSALAGEIARPLTEAELALLRGVGEPLDLREVEEVYVPLSRLLAIYVENARLRHASTRGFLHRETSSTTFVIAVAGSVAVGKSTVARVLRELLTRWESTPRVELVTTDGFLLPLAELERRGLLGRKGFPESYDRRALLRFVSRIKSGAPEVRAPVYSHQSYDIVPGEEIVVRQPDVLILEGLNVLQPSATPSMLSVSDLVDFGVYVDAATGDIRSWYTERFLTLRRAAAADPGSYLARFAQLSEAEARARAARVWAEINEPNLVENVRPTRAHADLVLRKGPDHEVRSVLLRKI